MFSSIIEMNSILLDCKKCPRLVKFREEVALRKNKYFGEKYWSKPVPGFGDINGKLLILGLAPAATGGNRTGRIFTGDKSAEFLVKCLYRVGFTNKDKSERMDDGLVYYSTYVTAVLKCVPPDDKPDSVEIENCFPYLKFEIDSMKNLKAILVLGRVAFNVLKNYFRENGINLKNIEFKHGESFSVNNIRIFMSYHPSPRNVNTGKITEKSLIEILEEIKSYIQ